MKIKYSEWYDKQKRKENIMLIISISIVLIGAYLLYSYENKDVRHKITITKIGNGKGEVKLIDRGVDGKSPEHWEICNINKNKCITSYLNNTPVGISTDKYSGLEFDHYIINGEVKTEPILWISTDKDYDIQVDFEVGK